MGQRQKQYEVLRWINENFEPDAIQISDCDLFPHCKRITDKNGDEMLVYYDLLTNTVKYCFPDKTNDKGHR